MVHPSKYGIYIRARNEMGANTQPAANILIRMSRLVRSFPGRDKL